MKRDRKYTEDVRLRVTEDMKKNAIMLAEQQGVSEAEIWRTFYRISKIIFTRSAVVEIDLVDLLIGIPELKTELNKD